MNRIHGRRRRRTRAPRNVLRRRTNSPATRFRNARPCRHGPDSPPAACNLFLISFTLLNPEAWGIDAAIRLRWHSMAGCMDETAFVEPGRRSPAACSSPSPFPVEEPPFVGIRRTHCSSNESWPRKRPRAPDPPPRMARPASSESTPISGHAASRTCLRPDHSLSIRPRRPSPSHAGGSRRKRARRANSLRPPSHGSSREGAKATGPFPAHR